MPQRRSHFPGSSSNVTPLKRAATNELDPTPPSRQSQRLRRSSQNGIKTTPSQNGIKTTPKKSPYFERASSETSAEESSDHELDDSGYEDEDASVTEESVHDVEEGDGDSADSIGNRHGASSKKTSSSQKRVKHVAINGNPKTAKIADDTGKELWRTDVTVDAEAGQEVFIALPKARSAGKIPYSPESIHPNTLLFLGDLRKNNDREWLKIHDADYRQAKSDWDSFVDAITPEIAIKDDTIPELPHKDLTFRIYRDIRFSPDPTPYKTHFSAAWSRTGRKGPYAGYYAQIQPGGSFVGAGIWHPEAAPLALLRAQVDNHSERLKKILMEDKLRKVFMGGVKAEQMACVKKFIDMNKENMLKTKPRDYDVFNPNIGLLRLRNYTIGKKVKDEDILGKNGLSTIVELMGILVPFVTYLNSVVMPDEEPDNASISPGSSDQEHPGENADDDDDDDDGDDGLSDTPDDEDNEPD